MRLMPVNNTGPPARVTDADVYWMLRALEDDNRLGRKRLSEIMDLGEGSTRRALDILRDCGFVEIYQTGIVISQSGREFLESIPIVPVQIEVPGSVIGEFQESVLVKGASEMVRNGQSQRDAGIKIGSLGCTTIVYRDGALMIPPDWNLDEKSPKEAEMIRKVKEFTPDDVVIIGGADNLRLAMNAAVSAALELI
ncbi:MAG: hypothetical protein Q4Q62_01085 [Thermoplasmata archaeon]|nr:hypothetical protein [Thermoplasmata archaeon]